MQTRKKAKKEKCKDELRPDCKNEKEKKIKITIFQKTEGKIKKKKKTCQE